MKQKRRSCLIFWLIFFVLFPVNVIGSELAEKIRGYFRENDLEAAREFLFEHLESNPEDREAKFFLGKVHFDGDSSLKYLSESMDLTEKGGKSAEALLWMCKYSFLNGSYPITLEQTKEFEKRFGQSLFLPEVLWLSGSSYLIAGYRAEAQSAFERILEEYPQSEWAAWALLGLGDCFFSKREFEPAIVQYKKLVDFYANSDPFPLALISLSWSLVETEDAEKAYFYYNIYKDRFSSKIAGEQELLAKIRTQFSEKIKKDQEQRRKAAEYTIQIGLFSTKAQADRELRRFQAKRYTTNLVQVSKDQQVLWRVEVGIFDSQKRAENLKTKLEKQFGGTYKVISR